MTNTRKINYDSSNSFRNICGKNIVTDFVYSYQFVSNHIL